MTNVYDNGSFCVEADPRESIYRVINKSTGMVDERCTNMYEAIRYAQVFKEGIEQMSRRTGEEWPVVAKDNLN